MSTGLPSRVCVTGRQRTLRPLGETVFCSLRQLLWVHRDLGGRSASGDVLIFLDADVRLPRDFFERFLEEFEHRQLDVASPQYVPYRSTRTVERFHARINFVLKAFQQISPSGSGMYSVVRGDLFRGSRGFDPAPKFAGIELNRRISKRHRFGIVEKRVFAPIDVSEKRECCA